TAVYLDAGAGFSSYKWSEGSTEQKITVTKAGKYWVELVNDKGCIGRDTVEVKYANPRAVIRSGPRSFCSGSSARLESDMTDPGFTYQWQKNGLDIDGATLPHLEVSESGRYKLIINAGECSSNSPESEVTIIPVPMAELGDNVTLCEGQTITLKANTGGPFNYLWSNGTTSETITSGAAGQYWVKVWNTCDTVSDTVYP
ncbi:MAG: hypothetical protein M3Q97_10245, partial [Bacteroidota bacterium]|nr:hypothetical protein [Bacteroidota bacterium]